MCGQNDLRQGRVLSNVEIEQQIHILICGSGIKYYFIFTALSPLCHDPAAAYKRGAGTDITGMLSYLSDIKRAVVPIKEYSVCCVTVRLTILSISDHKSSAQK